MERFIYRAKLREDAGNHYIDSFKKIGISIRKLVTEDVLMTLSVHRYNDNLFVYYECIKDKMLPEQIMPELNAYLEKWPGLKGFRYWVPMMDIFHYNRPLSAEHWRRKQPVQRIYANALRLKPEMYSSYIFYHYQLQEERPSIHGDKYGIIAAHEDFLFFYHEEPAVIENPSLYEGKLKTSNTPSGWIELMLPHFNPLEENTTGRPWMDIETIFIAAAKS